MKRMARPLLSDVCAPRQLTRQAHEQSSGSFAARWACASYTEDAETAAQLIGSGEGLDAGAGALDEASAGTTACGWRRRRGQQITELNRLKIRAARCSGGGDACALRARARSRVVGCSWQEVRRPAWWLCDGQLSSEAARRAEYEALDKWTASRKSVSLPHHRVAHSPRWQQSDSSPDAVARRRHRSPVRRQARRAGAAALGGASKGGAMQRMQQAKHQDRRRLPG